MSIPNSVTSIERNAFSCCTNLCTVLISGNLTSIEEYAFDNCNSLGEVFYLGESQPSIADHVFYVTPVTIYVKDTSGFASSWDGRPVKSWRSGKGDGTEGNPLVIEDYAQLMGFAIEVSQQGSKTLCGILAKDIVGNSNVLKSDGSLNGNLFKEWMPIGSATNVFCGEFNGGGHTISGLYHSQSEKGSCVGLFGRTGEGAYIHDLGLVDSYMSGGQWNAGICGDMAYGLIDNCYNAATVTWGGGITMSCWVNAQITNCFNIGHIYNGGGGITAIVYSNPNVTYGIDNCYSLTGVSNNAINGYDGNCTGKVNNVEALSSDAFASGEVCWKLNGKAMGTQWSQKIGTDKLPKFNGTNVVYHDDVVGYVNVTKCDVAQSGLHSFNSYTPSLRDGTKAYYLHCSDCGKYYRKDNLLVAVPEPVWPLYGTRSGTYKGQVEVEGGIYHLYQNYSYTFEGTTQSVSGNCAVLVSFIDNPTPTNKAESTVSYGGSNYTVVAIGEQVFYDNDDLIQEFTIPNTVRVLEAFALEDNRKALNKIILEDGDTDLFCYRTTSSYGAFSWNEALKNVYIGRNLKYQEQNNNKTEYAPFYKGDFRGLSVEFGPEVTAIPQNCFHSSDVISVDFSKATSLNSIGRDAFYSCINIKSLTFGPSFKSMGQYASLVNSATLVTFKSLPDFAGSEFQGAGSNLDLTDSDKPFIGTTSLPKNLHFLSAQYHRTLAKDKWGTIVLPFAPTGGMEGLEFYELKRMTTASGGSLVFTKVETVKAGVPYLFRNTSSTTDFTLTNAGNPTVTVGISNQTAGDVTLKGSFQQMQLDGTVNHNLYYLSNGEFYHANGKINIAPFRAYIEASGSSGAAARNFLLLVSDDGNEVTAIADILDEDGAIDEAEVIYDLNGRQLDAPVKGQVNIVRTKGGKTIKRMF